MVTVSGNPNPTNPTYSTNPTTEVPYGCEFVNLNCIYARVRVKVRVTKVRKWTTPTVKCKKFEKSARTNADAILLGLVMAASQLVTGQLVTKRRSTRHKQTSKPYCQQCIGPPNFLAVVFKKQKKIHSK